MKRLLRLFQTRVEVPLPSGEWDHRLGYHFANPELFLQAITHRSFHNESPGLSSGHNERLEFLGDAALGLAISGLLMETAPTVSEGTLSKWRATLVNENALASKAQSLGLAEALRLGRGEEKTAGRQKPRLQACAFEALVGAMYVEAGFAQVEKFVRAQFAADVTGLLALDEAQVSDYKTRLQERTQALAKKTPHYRLHADQGPDHDKRFVVQVFLEEELLGQGIGRSKKQAEQMAAKMALEKAL